MPSLIIATDASYIHDKHLGSWAVYIKSPAGIIQRSGIIRDRERINGSTTVERYAIANALFIADKAFNLSEYDVTLCCDNEDALYPPRIGKNKIKQDYWLEWYETYVQTYIDKTQSYRVQHVKGHLARSKWEPGNELHAMNRWCDKQARKLTRNYIEGVE